MSEYQEKHEVRIDLNEKLKERSQKKGTLSGGGDSGAGFSSLKKFKIPQRLSIPISSL